MDNKLRISVVLCTYNGAAFLREQLDSIVRQSYPLHELIIQDDGSTDDTAAIAQEYVQRYSYIQFRINKGPHGYNPNFFSAFRQASGDYIAISDQDDIWEPTKIERQMQCIGNHLLCTHRSQPFSGDGSVVHYDPRRPNVGMLRLQYASIPGHTILFHRDLLRLIPDVSDGNYYGTAYDVILSITAAAYEQLVMVDEVLVHQRRHVRAATFSDVDFRRTPGIGNAAYIFLWSLRHFGEVKPLMRHHFQRRLTMLEQIHASTSIHEEAKRMLRLQSSEGFMSLCQLGRLFIKHRFEIFYSRGKDPQNWLRAALFPLMQVYNYRYLLAVR